MEQPNPTPVDQTESNKVVQSHVESEVVASESNVSVENTSPLDETHYVDANSTRDSLNEEQCLNDSLDKSVTLPQIDEEKSLDEDKTLEDKESSEQSSDKSSGKSLESEPWDKIDENEANMTSLTKENDEAKDEQPVKGNLSQTESQSSTNEISEAKFGVLNSTLTSQWSQSVEEKAEEKPVEVEEKESKVSTPESEPCDSPRSSIEDQDKVEENMEEAQVTEENAEASSYEVLQSLTQSEMGMSLKSLPESPMKTQDPAKTDESPAETSEAEQTADAEQKEAATSSEMKEESAETGAENKPAEAEKPKEPEDMDVLGNGLIMKKILVKFKKETPPKYSFVTVVVSCEKLNIENEEMKFVLADEEVCQALDLSVQMMDINEKAQIISDGKYCVHALDKKKLEFKDGDKIIYTVELTKCESGPYSATTDVNLKLDWANNKKLQGNNYYSKQLFGQSAQLYSKVA